MKLSLVFALVSIFVAASATDGDFKSVLRHLLSKMTATSNMKREHATIDGSKRGPGSTYNDKVRDWMERDRMNEEFGDWKKSLLLPGSDYLFRILSRYAHFVPTVEEINTDVSTMYDVGFITERIQPVWRALNDAESVAVYLTRRLVDNIVSARINCPTAVFDRFIARSMIMELDGMLKEEGSIRSLFKSVFDKWEQSTGDDLMLFSMIQTLDTEELATNLTKELHTKIYTDLIDYFVAFSYTDVSRVAHMAYRAMYETIAMYDPQNELPVEVVAAVEQELHSILITSSFQCPTREQMVLKHSWAARNFSLKIDSMERNEVCSAVKTYLLNNVPSSVNYNEIFIHSLSFELCDLFRGLMTSAAAIIMHYEYMITNDNTDYMEYFRNIVPPNEFEIMQKVLEMMGWTYAPNNLIPVDMVMENEKSDIEIWQGFISNLNAENFNSVDYTDFAAFINNWLVAKRNRILEYKNAQIDSQYPNIADLY